MCKLAGCPRISLEKDRHSHRADTHPHLLTSYIPCSLDVAGVNWLGPDTGGKRRAEP